MSLKIYHQKRRFNETPEPRGSVGDRASRHLPIFCIQRHDATRLHYDFRLEMNGALASWAVPQGPSLDPSVKRLAVKVEDHPLDYATFEGNIPKGNYGGGSVMLWDFGTWHLMEEETPLAEQMERGDLKFELEGKKLHGKFGLIRMKPRGRQEEWLLIKKKDEFASADWNIDDMSWSVQTGRSQAEIATDRKSHKDDPWPGAIRPMLATLAKEPPAGRGWVYEVKWDGVRAMARLRDGELQLISRQGDDITDQYPELASIAQHLSTESAILDGEIVVADDQGRPRFELIQPRIMARGASAIARMASQRPARYFAFDLLYHDGRDLRDEPLSARKAELTSILKPSPEVQISPHFDTSGTELLNAARQLELEGILAKRSSSVYISKRSADWVKVKIANEGDYLICGYTKGKREHFSALLLGERDGKGTLVYRGNVGTGFDEKGVRALYRKLHPLERPRSPFPKAPKLPQEIVWVQPELTCAVRYLEMTSAGHLRAPVFVGLREPDVDRETESTGEATPTARTAGRKAAKKSAKKTTDAKPAGPRSAPSTEDEGEEAKPTAIPSSGENTTIRVEGHALSITHLNKILFPEDKVTKRDLLTYYDQAAEWLVPHWEGRPLSLLRYPNGIDKKGFFQKNIKEEVPDWMQTADIETDEGMRRMMVGSGRAHLLYLTNLACIDQNPWMSRIGSLEHPDFVLIDLDAHEAEFRVVVDAALRVHALLDSLGLQHFAKVTGGDGMHVLVPVAPVYSYDQTKAFTEVIARYLASEDPRTFTLPRSLAKRTKGKIYLDWVQNGEGKTISAPYSVRPKPGAPVATPVDWDEVKPGLDPSRFHIRNAIDRFRSEGDLLKPMLKSKQRLEKALEKMDGLLRTKPQETR